MPTSGFDDGTQWLTRGEAAQAGRTKKAPPTFAGESEACWTGRTVAIGDNLAGLQRLNQFRLPARREQCLGRGAVGDKRNTALLNSALELLV